MPDPPHCLRCNKAVEDTWQICPYCEAVLKGHARGSRGGVAHDLLEWAENRLNRLWVQVVAAIGCCGALLSVFGIAMGVGGLMWGKTGVTLAILSMLLGSACVAGVFGRMRNKYKGRFVRVGILSALFLVGAVALVSCLVGSVLMIGFGAKLYF